jgi:ParB-like chromosome segregation protein Spo0J
MNIQVVKISDINTAEYNPRIIRKDEFDGLKSSLKIFGQQENFIINKNGTLISGHQRLEAAKQLGWKEVTANVVNLTPKEEKKLNLIMNSRAVQGVFDELKLAEILEEIKFDDDYTELRFDTLEPLDLSNAEFDAPTTSDE